MLFLNIETPRSRRGASLSFNRHYISIGRFPGNDLVLAESHISGRHAHIRYCDGRYLFSDLGSTNGSMVLRDDEALLLGPRGLPCVALSSNDLLVLGDMEHPVRVRVTMEARPARPGQQDTVLALRGPDQLEAIRRRVAEDQQAVGVLLRLVEQIGTASGEQDIVELVMEAALEAIPGALDVLLVQGDGDGDGDGDEAWLTVRAKAHRGAGICGRPSPQVFCRAREEGSVILYGQHDEAALPAQTLVSLGMGSGIAAPLWHQGQATAVLQINCAPGHYVLTELHLDLATVLAHHASVALERARLTEQAAALQQRLARTERLEAMGLLASGLAHDFNNLLAPIICYADAGLGCTSPDDEVQQDLLGIRDAARQAAVLTRQLLAFGRGRAGRVEVVDLNELLQDMGPLLTRLAGGASLEISPWEKPARVEADPAQVQQTLLNLVVNAADAVPEGAGRLHLETHVVQVSAADTAGHPELRPGTFVLLAVSDNGAGMDPATAERIFDPFFTTKRPGKGTGLGLATVYSILTRLGGSVAVFSEPGVGTVFELLIPAAEPDQEEASPYCARTVAGARASG